MLPARVCSPIDYPVHEVAPSAVGVPTLELFSPEALRSTVITFRDTMRAHAAGINRLNVYPVPDGDTGTNMARTLDAVVAEMEPGRPRARPDVRRDQPRLR